MRYEKALEYLSRYTNYERALRYPYDGWAMNLERVRGLLEGLGDPDRGLSIVHIAGTKGKGSTAAMIEAVARAAGLHTGMYTSPHLIDFKERIRVSGRMVTEDAVARWVERLMPAAESVHAKKELGTVTYFEILTALAFAVFGEARVDLAVVEAGLGGRYDATNACEPLVSVMTSISLDHTDILGDTIAEIAAEKSMIVKPGAAAVFAPQPKEARAVLEARCEEVGVTPVWVEDRYAATRTAEDIGGQSFDLSGGRELKDLRLPLLGDPQLINAAAAVAAADELSARGIMIDDGAVRGGLNALRWPARFEVVSRSPDVILDGAHNAASAAGLRGVLERLYPGRRVTAVIGLGGDKDVEGFCRELGPVIGRAVITRSRAMKAAAAERIESSLAEFGASVERTGSVAEAMGRALGQAGSDDVVVVTGSFYVISEWIETARPRS